MRFITQIETVMKHLTTIFLIVLFTTPAMAFAPEHIAL